MSDYHKISEGILGEETVEKTNTELFLSLVGQYFPEAIKDGEVDFTALKEEMGEFPEVKSEHYEFSWAGKQAAKKEAQADLFGRTLKYKPQDSLNPDNTENIYIEGDNLEALKLLRRNYHGQIKLIYIDPPYNRGDDLIYRDTFTLTEAEVATLSQDNVKGEQLQKVTKDDAKYHTKWLNMIYPRLRLARELLAEDGVIFISIDDNEIENLKKICVEIFGLNNYIAEFSIASNSAKNNSKFVSITHEYLLCFAKNKVATPINWQVSKNNSEDFLKICKSLMKSGKSFDEIHSELLSLVKYPKYYEFDHYTYIDDRGPFRASDLTAPGSTAFYDVIHPITHKPCKLGTRGWAYSESEMQRIINENYVMFGKDENVMPQLKNYLFDNDKSLPKSILFFDSQSSTKWVKAEKLGFDYPKSVDYIKYILSMYPVNNYLVLDFFSGSSTTAHAVMELNAEDGGSRKYIMVQYPEKTYRLNEKGEEIPTNEGKASYYAGFKTISQLGRERIKRAIKKICNDYHDPIFDMGYKAFEITNTNIRWNTADDEEISLLTDTDYSVAEKDRIDFNKGYTDIDVVYEVMLRQFDIPLSTPIEKLSSVSDRTYIFANAVVVCLEPEIDEQLIERLAAIEPTPAKFVLRDSAFNDDIELKDVSFRRLSALIANHQTEEERKSKYNNYTVEFI